MAQMTCLTSFGPILIATATLISLSGTLEPLYVVIYLFVSKKNVGKKVILMAQMMCLTSFGPILVAAVFHSLLSGTFML
jgi:hypothetical protein